MNWLPEQNHPQPDASWETGYNTDPGADAPLESTTGNFTTAHSHTITGLSSGTQYAVFVRTVVLNPNNDDEILDNAHSAWRKRTVTTGSFGPPDPPENLIITSNDGLVWLDWSPPEEDGYGEITGYGVRWRQTGTTSWSTATTNAETTDYTITGETVGTTIEISLRATNQYGNSEWTPSETAPVVGDPPDGPPGRPHDLSLVEQDRALFAEWDADSSHAAPSHYKVHYRKRGHGWETPLDAPYANRTLFNLTNCVEYIVRIVAHNDFGESPPSLPATGTPGSDCEDGTDPDPSPGPDPNPNPDPDPPEDATVPGRPGNLSLSPGNGQFTASWSAPDNAGGSAITHYELLHRARGQEWEDPINVGNVTSRTVTGKTNGTNYIVRIVAHNAVGESRPSLPKTTTPQENLNNAAPPPDGNTPEASNLQPVPALPAWALGALVALLFGHALRLRRR